MRSVIVLVAVALAGCSKKKDDGDQATSAKAAPAKDEEAAGAASPAEPPATESSAELLARLSLAAHCDDTASPFRPWCIAANGWSKGGADDLPSTDAVLPGLTIDLQEGKSAAEALATGVSFSALALRHRDGKTLVKIDSVRPQTQDESQQVGAAVASLALVFKGKTETATLPESLAGYLATLPAGADHELARHDHGWAFAGASPAELRKVDAYWVAIETPQEGPGGIFVSIFTDKTTP